MEELSDILTKINIPTIDLGTELIQVILVKAQKSKNTSDEDHNIWRDISQTLWLHLQTGLKKTDDNLLCGTCFYTVLRLIQDQESYLLQINQILSEELRCKQNSLETLNKIQTLSIIYGIFQSGFLVNASKSKNHLINILKSLFDLLISMGYEYTRHTFLVFKIIYSYKRVLGTELEELIFSNQNQVRLLNLVNHNWENPITGVRDLNKNIFRTLLMVMDNEMKESVMNEINDFPWNKAKYLMISEFINQCPDPANVLVENHCDWIDGLLHSLQKPGLVSAGADMYFAILNKLSSEHDWCTIFLSRVTEILLGSCLKTIENFTNYWYLNTLKKYPLIINIIISQIEVQKDSEMFMYSYLSILKQGNKLGLIHKDWKCQNLNIPHIKIINDGLQHCHTNLRMLAFEILCVSQSKPFPSKTEYELVYNYIYYNINSDCTVLRINMLNCLKLFLTYVHSCSQNVLRHGSEIDIEDLKSFCKKIQELIMYSLGCNGNYQRKITSIKLCNVFIQCLSQISKKKQQSKQNDFTLMCYLQEKDLWLLSEDELIKVLLHYLKDAAEDVRSNVVQLLLTHYFTRVREKQIIDNLIEDAFNCIGSKFFYQISCAESMFRLIANILLEDSNDNAIFKNVEDIFYFSCSQVISEYELNRDIVESIEIGKQLHSFMSVIQTVLEVCLHRTYKLQIRNDTMASLLKTMNGIANQFVWQQENETSSDFSKMNDMIKDIIKRSPYGICSQEDQAKISGLEQSVLNCLWLNVKATCDLSSLIIRTHSEDSGIDVCKTCLHIITHVLETSRHKGAIEAAGAALGLSITHLTSLHEDTKLTELPFTLLKCKLNELVSETSKMASITRRGAGLSIMIHRIVASDTTKDKRLFHFFMKVILEKCKNAYDNHYEAGSNSKNSDDNEKDLPKAIYIHFLTRIVTDSSLASDVMYYSSNLGEIAFDNLTSSCWQIRNAALQLYGALIPKLMGQKKPSGTDEETIATVACDEFRTHSPKLWAFIVDQLKQKNNADEQIQTQSNLVPILNVLKGAKRYNFSYDLLEQEESDINLLNNFIILLGSPIYTVRRLTAKCVFNNYTFSVIYDVLMKQKHFTENFLHGILLLLQICHKHYNSGIYRNMFNDLKEKINNILTHGKHSYITRAIFEDMFYCVDLHIDYVINTLSELNNSRHEPGIYSWANLRIYKYMKNISWNDIPEVLNTLLRQSDYNIYCEYLMEKLEKSHCKDTKILKEIACILYSFVEKCKSHCSYSTAFSKVLYELSIRTELSFRFFPDMYKNCTSHESLYMIPFVSKIVVSTKDINMISNLSKIIFTLSDPNVTADVDLRYIAALSNNEFANAFTYISDEIKINSMKTVIILLQDEDEDVRSKSAEFYSNVTVKKNTLNPYICLHKILEYDFLNSLFSEPNTSIHMIYTEIHKIVDNMNKSKIDEFNPFANDVKNIYFEVDVIKSLIKKLMNKINI